MTLMFCDLRKSHQSLHSLDATALRSVSVHPLHKHFLLVAENRCAACTPCRPAAAQRFDLSCRMVKIYDQRCLKAKSEAVSELRGHSLSITSAYFSPSTGNRVLTSCSDNLIRWGGALRPQRSRLQARLTAFVFL